MYLISCLMAIKAEGNDCQRDYGHKKQCRRDASNVTIASYHSYVIFVGSYCLWSYLSYLRETRLVFVNEFVLCLPFQALNLNTKILA